MKSLSLIIILLICLCLEIKAQALSRDINFNANYPFHLQTNNIYGIIEEPDGSFLLHGYLTTLGGPYPINTVKFYSNGNVNHNFEIYPYATNDTYYAKRISSGYFIFNNLDRIRKVDLNTGVITDSTLWYNQTPNNPAMCGITLSSAHLLASGDSNFFGGYCCTQVCPYWLYKITPEGFLDSTFTNDVNGPVLSIKEYNDSLIMVSGYFTEFGGQPANRLVRITKSGKIDTTFQSIVTSGGGFITHFDSIGRIIFGGEFKIQGLNDTLGIVRFMPDGSLDNTFNNSAMINQIGQFVNTACPTTDGGYLIGGRYYQYDGYNRSCIVKTDANGFIDTSYLNGSGFEYVSTTNGLPPQIQSITKGNNDKYYITGQFDTFNGDFTPFVVRLHGLSVSVDEIENEKMDLEIYPNPASTQLFTNQQSVLSYEIIQIDGKRTLQGSSIPVDISSLSKGLYFIKINTKNTSMFHKFIKH